MAKNFYRFRSVKYLLDEKYQELERQTIHFADLKTLNDPMEGYRDIFWQGDLIVWRNLIKCYLFCLQHAWAFLAISGKDADPAEFHMPVYADKHTQPQGVKNIYDDICEAFFKYPEVNSYLENISRRSTPVRKNELLCHIKKLHPIALDAVAQIYFNHGLSEQAPSLNKHDLLQNLSNSSYFDSIEGILNEHQREERFINAFFDATAQIHNQMDLINRYKLIGASNAGKEFIVFDFPEKFIVSLAGVVHPKWYTACFMSKCTNSSVWGSYGNNHTGVCMIFKSRQRKNPHTLKITKVVGESSYKKLDGEIVITPVYQDVEDQLHKINYRSKHVEIDFFRSLGVLPTPVIMRNWYMDEGRKVSVCSDGIFKEEDVWRKKYWDKFNLSAITKSADWRYENEYRLILYSSLSDLSSPEDRTVKYDFSSLYGIIFGINTRKEDKLKIMKIIEEKCRQNDRKDFKFYQAFFSHEKNCVDHAEMGLLKFKGLSE